MTVLQFLNEHVKQVDAGDFSIQRFGDGLDGTCWAIYHKAYWVNNGQTWRTLTLACEWLLRNGEKYAEEDNLRRFGEYPKGSGGASSVSIPVGRQEEG